jgi:hypothetical protein
MYIEEYVNQGLTVRDTRINRYKNFTLENPCLRSTESYNTYIMNQETRLSVLVTRVSDIRTRKLLE